MPRVRKIGSHAVCECTVPYAPGEAPIRPTGRSRNTRGTSAGGRVIQSIAFLKTPGIELLYSGVTRSSASAAATFSFSSAARGGRRPPPFLLQRGGARRNALRRLHVAVIQRDATDRFDLERRAGGTLLLRGAQQ